MKFVNFYPHEMGDVQRITVDEHAGYQTEDAYGLIDSMARGCVASCPVDGLVEALRDGALLSDLGETYGQRWVDAMADEITVAIEGVTA